MYGLFDLIVLVVVTVLGFAGLRRGLIEEAFKLVGLVLGLYLAMRYYSLGIWLIKGIFSIAEGIQTVVGFLIVFLIIYFTVKLIAMILKRLVRALSLVWLDRLAGLCFGALKALLIMAIVVWCINIFAAGRPVQKLATTSMSFIYLNRWERFLIQTLQIEAQSDSLQGAVQGILKTPGKAPLPLPSVPDSLIHKVKMIEPEAPDNQEHPW
jgi:membrane protein required for colicin V production